MPVCIAWLVEGSVSYFAYYGDVTLDEMREASAVGLALLQKSDRAFVHTIQENRGMTSFPTDARALMTMVRESLQDSKMGWLISVGVTDRITSLIATLVSQMTRTRYRAFGTYEEAIAFLNSIDADLPDLSTVPLPTEDQFIYIIDHSITANGA